MLCDAAANCCQNVIASLMTIDIVDRLEPIDVDQCPSSEHLAQIAA